MVSAIYPYLNAGFQVLETGLAHSTFLGRMVSWGVFYGTAYFAAKKVYEYVAPKFRDFMQGHCWCVCHKETPKRKSLPREPVERKKISADSAPISPTLQNSTEKVSQPITPEKPQEIVKKK